MRMVIIVLAVMALCVASSQSLIDFTFQCNSEENATVTSYSYLKEPGLQESGYTRGLKTGSFNYLKDGEIELKETIEHTYDGGSPEGNSSLTHKLNLNFTGERGISEFYAKGFFKNNRAISAWKKIRYENLTGYENMAVRDTIALGKYGGNYSRKPPSVHYANKSSTKVSFLTESPQKTATLGKTRNASHIETHATVDMNTEPGHDSGPYDFTYVANVTDAVVETWDATGWSNRTGARRVDWEHTSLMSGDLRVVNNLSDSTIVIPGKGDESPKDWLPCCIGGGKQFQRETEAEIKRTGEEDPGWPNGGTYATLKPDKLLPTREVEPRNLSDPADPCYQDCSKGRYSINSTRSKNESCTRTFNESFTCVENNCPGYECIYTYDEDGTTYNEEPNNEKTQDITIKVHCFEVSNNASRVNYTVQVANSGKTKLPNVSLNCTLPVNMTYVGNSSHYNETKWRPPLEPDICCNNNNTTKYLNWSLGEFSIDDAKTIMFAVNSSAYMSDTGNVSKACENSSAQARGFAPNGTLLVESGIKGASPCGGYS